MSASEFIFGTIVRPVNDNTRVGVVERVDEQTGKVVVRYANQHELIYVDYEPDELHIMQGDEPPLDRPLVQLDKPSLQAKER